MSTTTDLPIIDLPSVILDLNIEELDFQTVFDLIALVINVLGKFSVKTEGDSLLSEESDGILAPAGESDGILSPAGESKANFLVRMAPVVVEQLVAQGIINSNKGQALTNILTTYLAIDIEDLENLFNVDLDGDGFIGEEELNKILEPYPSAQIEEGEEVSPLVQPRRRFRLLSCLK